MESQFQTIDNLPYSLQDILRDKLNKILVYAVLHHYSIDSQSSSLHPCLTLIRISRNDVLYKIVFAYHDMFFSQDVLHSFDDVLN